MDDHLAYPQDSVRLVGIELDREVVVPVKLSDREAVISYIRENCQRFRVTCSPPIQAKPTIDFLVAGSLQIYGGVIASIDEEAYRYQTKQDYNDDGNLTL